jgi:hypothetical protein
MIRRTMFVLVLLAFAFVSSASPYKAAKYCTPKQGDANFCGNQSGPGNGYTCLHWHPDEEFCMEENAPLPSCCRATEKNNSGITSCACCSSVHGGKRIINVKDVGWYQHVQTEVEYAQ